MRALPRLMLAGGLCLFAAGCHHKQPVVVIPVPASTPVALDKEPATEQPGLVAPVPTVTAPVPEVTVVEKKVKKPRKKVTAPVTAPAVAATAAPAPTSPPPSVQVASAPAAPATDASVIGELTAGGTQEQSKAMALITALDKRLGGLSDAMVEAQREQIARVRNFSIQAKAAYYAGDADGAATLATKGKLLLDDVTK